MKLIGSEVKISDGPHKGLSGTIVATRYHKYGDLRYYIVETGDSSTPVAVVYNGEFDLK